MPLHIIQGDISFMNTDAVVNAANSRLQRGGGVCGAIFARADGMRLQAACNAIGFCETGGAVITDSFGLKAKYIIHAVGPLFRDGRCGEEALLRSAYIRSLELVRLHGLRSVAFPLISAGIYGYPRAEALRVALDAIGGWLLRDDADTTVYLTLLDRAACELEPAVRADLYDYLGEADPLDRESTPDMAAVETECAVMSDCASLPCAEPLGRILRLSGEGFSEALLRLIDERGLSDPEVYRRANLDRRLFSKIRSNPGYQPGKNTVLALCIALELPLSEANALLRLAGFALSPASRFDLIVEYFLDRGGCSIHEVNEALFAFGEKTLGAQEASL